MPLVPSAVVQDVWNHCVSDLIRKAMDAKDYLKKYMDNDDIYMTKYMDVNRNVNGLLTNLKFAHCCIQSFLPSTANDFSFWARVKWNEYYSEFNFESTIDYVHIRLNILFIDIYYLLQKADHRMDDRVIFNILDFLPRTVNDGENHTLLLQNYHFKNCTKGRDVDTLQQIANRCRVPVEAMYYMLDVFEVFTTDQKWKERILTTYKLQNAANRENYNRLQYIECKDTKK